MRAWWGQYGHSATRLTMGGLGQAQACGDAGNGMRARGRRMEGVGLSVQGRMRAAVDGGWGTASIGAHVASPLPASRASAFNRQSEE
ncbi:hypothetical protein chiPu_0015505 [Chiloscyllium punctatum]|uniref:Uncharacterized protein n=1 Tax=Chiloscyllium punctatum TaxID=137246 RepID=A0A401T2X5_CHIPU|nr:hypothetical protein [Chiloscyllium punctatum]